MNERASPNRDPRPSGTPIDTLVLHYTGMRSAAAALDRLCNPEARVSSHYLVEEDGTIWRLVPESSRAWHAGLSFWRGHRALNDRSVGIEIVNPGHEWGYRPFPEVQMAAVIGLCRELIGRHPIPPRNVVAHSDIAPDRKQDPGELFDFARLARNGVGLYSNVADLGTGEAVVDAAGLAPVRRDLTRVGYEVATSGAWDPRFGLVLTAFQRHFRPEAVNGAADRGTRARLARLVQLGSNSDQPCNGALP